MKRIIPIFVLVATLFSCGENEKVDKKPGDNFTIYGKIEGAENTPVYLEAYSQEGTIAVAEGKVDADGTLKMSGNVPALGIYQLRLGEAQDKIIPLTLSPDENLKIKTTFDKFASEPNASGTKWAADLNQYMKLATEFAKNQQQLQALQNSVSEDEIMKKFSEMKKPLDEFARNAMLKDPSNPFNIVLATSATPVIGFQYWDPSNIEVLKKVAAAFQKTYKGSVMAGAMQNQADQVESAYKEYLLMQSGEKPAPEIALKNPQGETIKLSSLKGKVVLVDFWASWCGPCRKENPNVVRMYNQYKDKGFTVYSVSLDKDPNAWKQAIAADGLSWPNHVSDLLMWDTPLTQTYNFDAIPHTVLVDKKGNIAAVGLRGEKLEQKLIELLAN